MAKYYFEAIDSEECFTELAWIHHMKENGLTEIEVIEAEMETDVPFFYCTKYGFAGETGEGCGKECEEYKPRNKVSGRCIHSKNPYSPSGKKITLKT